MSGTPERTSEVQDGLWRFEALHPEWTEEEGGEEGWEQLVAWWALAGPAGLVLIDPLVEDWDRLDPLVERSGGCAGIVRTVHWHERSIEAAAVRYGAEVWARSHPQGRPHDHSVSGGDRIFDELLVIDVERADELALWLPAQAALLFGDAMLRSEAGTLHVCPPSWLQPEGGPERLRQLLRDLGEQLPVEHVLVSHGPLVLGDGAAALQWALDAG